MDVETYGFQYTLYSILNSGLGGAGDPLDNYCVNDGAFARGSYVPMYCNTPWASTQNPGECCLRRKPANNGAASSMNGIAQMLNVIISDPYYGIDQDTEGQYIDGQYVVSEILDGIRDNLEKGPHDITHCTIGSCQSYQLIFEVI